MATGSTENVNDVAETGSLMAPEMQCVVDTCLTHTSEVIDMYCSTCKQRYCLQCIKENHISHDWKKLSNVAQKIRDEITDKCLTVRETTLPRLKFYLREITLRKIYFSQNKYAEISKMRAQKERFKKLLNTNLNEKNSCINRSVAAVNQTLDSADYALQRNLSEIIHLVNTLEHSILTGSDRVIVDLTNKIERCLANVKKPNIQDLSPCPQFQEGKLNTDSLEEMFGSICVRTEKKKVLEKVATVSDVIDLKFGDIDISTVCQIKESNLVWFLKLNSSKIDCYSSKGKESNTELGVIISDFVINEDGDIIYAVYDNRCINRWLSKDGTISQICNTAPLHPQAIFLTKKGELLAALIDAYDYDIDKNNTRVIRRITMDGNLISTIQYQDNSKINLFTVPVSVCENYNSDICVIDRTGKRTGQLLSLYRFGIVKFRYTGQNVKKSFCPLGVAVDSKCNILVSDWQNHAIHLLSCSGEFIQFVLTRDDGLRCPRSLSLCRRRLWIGCHAGSVKCLNYNLKDA